MTIFHLIDDRSHIPAISSTTACISSSLLTLSYVGGLYISTRTRIGAARNKDGSLLNREDAVIVKSRLQTVCVTSGLSLLATGILIRHNAFPHLPDLIANLSTLRVLGYPLPVPSFLHSNALPFQPSLTLYTLHHILPSILSPILITSTLFLGPLYVAALDKTLPFQQNFSVKEDIIAKYDNVWGIRNYIIGPLTEEVIFRGCVLAVHDLAGIGRNKLIFLTPLYFGIGECPFSHVRQCRCRYNSPHSPSSSCVRIICQGRRDKRSSQAKSCGVRRSICIHLRIWVVLQLFVLTVW